MQQTIAAPNRAYRFFILPFMRDKEMYRQNGNPDPHEGRESRDPRRPRTAVSYQDGRLWGNVDLPALLTAIYRTVTVFSLGFLLITMRAERSETKTTPQAIAETIVRMSDDPTIKAAVLKLLTPEPADPAKAAPMKGTAKPKAKPVPVGQPKGPGALLRDDALHATNEPTLPIFGYNIIPLPEMRFPQ